jgi:hypothetical protein
MDIGLIKTICNELPHVTEDIKWGDDLCFMIGSKIPRINRIREPNNFFTGLI